MTVNRSFVCLSVALLHSLLGSWTGLLAADFVLVDQAGNTKAAPIITVKDAPPFTREAAGVLADCVEKISGSRPEVIAGEPQVSPARAIWVGVQPTVKKLFPKTNFDFKHHEEILVKANAHHMVIAGRDRWRRDHLVVKGKRETVNGVQREYGTANAVYTFIHDHLDVRWLWPGELGEHYEKRKSIVFKPFEHRYHPPLRARSKVLGFSVVLKHSAYGQSGVWARRQRIQLDSLDVNGGHAFKTWWDRFHKSHLEYFALQPDGKRSGYPSARYVKLCVSNPDVWKQWLADVETQLKHNPNLTIFNTSPNDSYATGHCVCENCKAWDHPDADLRPFFWAGEMARAPAMSDRDLRFANECARLLKERFPNEDYQVSVNAYGNARPAPLKTKPDDRVVVMSVCNNFWKLDTSDKDSLSGTPYARHYANWGKLTRKQVWRPNTGNPVGWQNGLPDVAIERMMESFQLAMKHGCIGVLIDSLLESWATQGSMYYVLARMTWDPSQDWRQVLDEYYQRGFGPAAADVKTYWQLLENSRNRKADKFPAEADGWFEVYDEAFFKRAYGLLDRGTAKLAASDKKYRRRIEFLRIGLDHTRLATELRELSLRMLLADGKDDTINDQVRAKWTAMEANAQRNPLAVYWPPLRPGERMFRGGLMHPDFMDKGKSRHLAAWRRKADELFGNASASSPAEATKLQDARSAGWHLVFQDEFDRKELGKDWKVVDGKWKIENNALVGSGTLISTRGLPADNRSGFHRLEFEAMTTLPGDAKVSDLSSFMQSKFEADDREPWKSGYYFQFGGHYNTVTQLAKAGKTLRLHPDQKITPRRVHKIVVENDRGKLRCFVDGKAVFSEADERSLIGPTQNHVGLYFYTPARVRKVRVYVKGLPDDLDVD